MGLNIYFFRFKEQYIISFFFKLIKRSHKLVCNPWEAMSVSCAMNLALSVHADTIDDGIFYFIFFFIMHLSYVRAVDNFKSNIN